MSHRGGNYRTILDNILRQAFIAICVLSAMSTNRLQYDIDIMDNCLPNTNVLDLNSWINADPNHSKMTYTLSQMQKASKYFEIKNNKIITKSTIDMDTMCREISECCNKEVDFCTLQISVIYSASPNLPTDIKTVIIRIQDVNDHSPQFAKPSTVIELLESKRDSQLVLLPSAVDPDFGKNRIQTYQIKSKQPSSFDDYFILDVKRDLAVPSQVGLRLNKMLDREKIDQFSFELLAIDGDITGKKTGSMSVTIKILDENDNIPIFQKTFYKEIIKEGVINNLPIVTLLATDADEGDNAKIVFELAPNFVGDSIITDQFKVESNGKIYLKKVLDYEKHQSYKFNVIATNPTSFSNRLVPLTATVEIEVENVDDESLQITIDYHGTKNLSKIPENNKGVFVALVSVRSTEFGKRNQRIDCKFQTHDDLFELVEKSRNDYNTKSFDIRTKIGIDRELYSRIQTNIHCTDLDSAYVKYSEATLVVNITDVNDNDPQLTVDGRTTVRENAKVGTVIFTVTANDPDENENGRVTFSLEKSDPVSLEYVTIDENNGRIIVKNKIDCEASVIPLTSFPIVVTASDHGYPVRSTDLKLIIEVQDVNDNVPSFVYVPLLFSVPENSPRFTSVGEIEVQDKDHSDKVTLKIINNNQWLLPFTISTKDNKIFQLNLTRSIDRENDPMFKFQVVAADGMNKNAHSVTESVEVKILDVNDNAPTILFPTQNNASVHRISYLEPINHRFILVSANDQDQPPDNSRLEYIVEDELKIFAITNEDKYITTQREMTKHDIGDHRLRIIVRDHGIPRLESVVVINIVIDQSAPKSASSSNNLKHNSVDRPSDNILSGNTDNIVYIIVGTILVVIIMVVFIFVYMLCCRKRDNNPCFNTLEMCCQFARSSPSVSKSMISSPVSKANYHDDQQMYNTHQISLINDDHVMDDGNFIDHMGSDNRVSSYTTAQYPCMGNRTEYTKLPLLSPPYQYPHVYQTIEDCHLAQRQIDRSMHRMPSYQIMDKTREQYQSDLNLKRWNFATDPKEFSEPDNRQGVPWIISQTPLPTRSRNITNTIMSQDSFENNFAVAFPQDQSTFV